MEDLLFIQQYLSDKCNNYILLGLNIQRLKLSRFQGMIYTNAQ